MGKRIKKLVKLYPRRGTDFLAGSASLAVVREQPKAHVIGLHGRPQGKRGDC